MKRTVVHATTVVERAYDATAAQVFAAWADPAAHGNWLVPGHGWKVVESERDFRVGGRDFSRFGPPGEPVYHSSGRFEAIVPNVRIVSAGTMHSRGTPTSSTLCTVEILAEHQGTRLIVTDQSAFFEGLERPIDREEGWRVVIENLARALLRTGAGRDH